MGDDNADDVSGDAPNNAPDDTVDATDAAAVDAAAVDAADDSTDGMDAAAVENTNGVTNGVVDVAADGYSISHIVCMAAVVSAHDTADDPPKHAVPVSADMTEGAAAIENTDGATNGVVDVAADG